MIHLAKKLLIDIRKSLGQFIAIAIISMIGTMLLTGMSVVHASLDTTIRDYYERSHLADLIISYTDITDEGGEAIRALEGVADVALRASCEGKVIRGNATFLVHTCRASDSIDRIDLVQGFYPSDSMSCILNEEFFQANHLALQDVIGVRIQDRDIRLTVCGTFHTAEYIYLIKNAAESMLPNYMDYGLLYLDPDTYSAITKNRKYDEALVMLEDSQTWNEGEIDDMISAIKALTDDYGYVYTTRKTEQSSYAKVNSEIQSAESMAKIFPYVFFLVSAAIILITMQRTVQNERNQIGIMKALGHHGILIAFFYMAYAVSSGLLGAILGNIVGIFLLPQIQFSTYRTLYTLPEMQLTGYIQYVILSVCVVIFFSGASSLITVMKTLRENPAQCLRGEPPRKRDRILLEKWNWLWGRLSHRTKLILRNIFFNKWRCLLSSLGIIGCVGLLLCGFGLLHVTRSFIQTHFTKIQQYDVWIVRTVPEQWRDSSDGFDILSALTTSSFVFSLNGNSVANVTASSQEETQVSLSEDDYSVIDKMSVIPISCTLNGNEEHQNMYVLDVNNHSIRLFDQDGNDIPFMNDGIIIPYKVARENGLSVGDEMELKLNLDIYDNRKINVRISGICELYVSQDFYITTGYLREFGVTPYTGGYYLTFSNVANQSACIEELRQMKSVNSVSVKAEQVEQFNILYQSTKLTVTIMIVLSACLALSVIYNISAINIFERSRDLATLKVLGYYQNEIYSLVDMENIAITAFGSILGVVFGYILFRQVLRFSETDSMYYPFEVTATMVFTSILITLFFTFVTNFFLRGTIRKIDMVTSLKSVE